MEETTVQDSCQKDSIFYESALSICSRCLSRVPAKLVIRNGAVFLQKRCEEDGLEEILYEDDAAYHLSKKDYDKEGTNCKRQTKIEKGCPYDCGLCPAHRQHTCIAIFEITKKCNLQCPICFANSGQDQFLGLNTISKMLDFLVDSENGEADILQLSGGEPTLHPDLIDMIRLARIKKIKYIMLNTNGLRIAEDEDFVRQLAQFEGRFEVYLQFDGLSQKTHVHFRGQDLSEVKAKAIKNLAKYHVPITLVATIEKGVNDHEIGDIVRFAMTNQGVRGVNFQPIAFFGRLKETNARDRITLSGIIRLIERQAEEIFEKGDIIPLPCNVQRVAVSYLARMKNKSFLPVTRYSRVRNYLPLIDNTFAFDADRILRDLFKKRKNTDCCGRENLIKDIQRIIPLNFMFKSKKNKIRYIDDHTFRITVTSFVDLYNFDSNSIQKECVHVITPDLKKIPFSSYNMFYRT